MSNPVLIFSGQCLTPLYDEPGDSKELPVNLAPSTVFPMGQLLVQDLRGAANDVQTITLGGSGLGGTFTLTVQNPVTGIAAVLNPSVSITLLNLQAALNAATAFGANAYVVTGTPGTTYVLTANSSGPLANLPIPIMTVTNVGMTGTTPTASIAQTTVGRVANTFVPYGGTGVAALTPPATAPTAAGNGSGSAFLAGTYEVQYTVVNAYGETTASPPVSVTITANQNIRVSAITGLDASATSVNFYVDGALAGSSTVTSGSSTQTDLAGAAPAAGESALPRQNTTGGKAVCALKYACKTDAQGYITEGVQGLGVGGEWGQRKISTPAYFCGLFATTDLVGLDARAVADLGRLWQGTVSSGVLRII
jgi:hypothetical protein